MSVKEQELVEVYNKSPNSLISKVGKVSVKQDSITAINSNSIILAIIGNGNYWVINDSDVNYWLLPKAKLKVEQYRREIVELLFDCDDYESGYYRFELNKPAQVSMLANKHEWKLENRGVLKFINSISADDVQKENYFENPLKSLTNRLIESADSINKNAYLEASIECLSVRISELEDKLKVTQNLESIIDRLSERIIKLEDKLKVTQNDQQSINYSKKIYPSNQSRNLKPKLIALVNIYNTNPELLEQKAIKVSEATDSINRRHTDSSQKIVLEKANTSNYWVIHDEVGIDCWLLPKSKLRIDQFRYETTKALFECHGYQPDYSSFNLVKPAKVIPLSTDEQTWQLEKPGILEFSVGT